MKYLFIVIILIGCREVDRTPKIVKNALGEYAVTQNGQWLSASGFLVHDFNNHAYVYKTAYFVHFVEDASLFDTRAGADSLLQTYYSNKKDNAYQDSMTASRKHYTDSIFNIRYNTFK